MYSNAQYHTLTEQAGDNDLWDELNDIESREAMQHQSRFQAASPYSRGNAAVIIMSMAQSTAQRIHSAFTSAWRAAQEARNRYPRRSFYENNTDMDLDRDFGIADLRPTDFEERTTTQNSNRNPFVILSNFPRQAISSPSDSHGLVSNLDVTLKHLYDYFFSRGLLPIVSNFFVEATTLLFTLWLSRILIKNVDWEQLSTCKDEDSCLAKWSDYYRKEPLGWVHWFIIEGFNILFSCYFIFVSWNFWQSLQHALTSQHIMHEKLGISKRKLQGGSITWDAVVTKLIEAQDSGEYRLALGTLDELIIAQRIMRKENFLIAFWNQNLLDTKVGSRYYWCPSLEWCCYSCILNFMFNHKYELRPAFYLDSDSLQRRLKVCGIIHGLLLPFLVMFVLLHFFLSQVYDLKTSRQYMGNKCWSSVAMHTFREFNELPHVFRKRLEPSYEVAENYINLFGKSEVNAAIGRVLVFVGGAVGGILLLLGVLNDAILLHVQLWGRNLLWYAGIAGIVYSIGKALVPTKEAQPSTTRNLFSDMDDALKQVSKHTHFYPENWKGRGWDANVYKSFGTFFDSKVKLFGWELVSLLLAPYILFVKLSKCAPSICEFALLSKSRVPGTGDVLGYATFDFDNFRDEAWEGRTMGKSSTHTEPIESLAESVIKNGNVEDASRQHQKPKTRFGKMEKSLFGFQAAHPKWKCCPAGRSMLLAVEDYRKAAISRERNLHIEAATRQLDTLTHLEHQETFHLARRFQSERMLDSHIPQVTSQPLLDDSSEATKPREQVLDSKDRNLLSTSQKNSLSVVHNKATSAMQQDPFHLTYNDLTFKPLGSSPLGLSTELRRILSMSTLGSDQDQSELDSTSVLKSATDDRRAERQYHWLERFHAHLETQKQQEENDDTIQNGTEISGSVPHSQKRRDSNDGASASSAV